MDKGPGYKLLVWLWTRISVQFLFFLHTIKRSIAVRKIAIHFNVDSKHDKI